MYQQNHGSQLCTQTSNLLGLNNLTHSILRICNQNEKESILKLKESTNNPLLLLKDRTIENSDDSDSSSDNSDENIRRKHNSIDGGSAAGGFGLVPIDHEGTIGVGRSG